MRAKLLILTLTCLTLIAFQNCGKAPYTSIDADNQSTSPGSQKVIGQSAGYTQITYDPQLELSTSPSIGHLSLDLTSGALNVVMNNQTYNCTADATRLQKARDLIANSQICEPGPLPPGYVSCMAIAVADLELSNSSGSVMLRREACNNGTFLCGDNDATLRSLLDDLRSNLPAGCN